MHSHSESGCANSDDSTTLINNYQCINILTYTMQYIGKFFAINRRLLSLLQSWQELIATNCSKLDQRTHFIVIICINFTNSYVFQAVQL
jgi:hypothetical protein